MQSNAGSGQRAQGGQGGHLAEPEPEDPEEPEEPDPEPEEEELIIGSGHLGHTGGTTCDFKIYRSSCPEGI